MKINQIYVPYWKWECFRYGMYYKIENETEMIKNVIEFMSNTELFSKSMEYVVSNWNNTMDNHLTNKSINRIAFIGQCACLKNINCPEYITRKAWKFIDIDKQILANIEAENKLKIWTLKKYESLSINGKIDVIKMDYQMKFQLD